MIYILGYLAAIMLALFASLHVAAYSSTLCKNKKLEPWAVGSSFIICLFAFSWVISWL